MSRAGEIAVLDVGKTNVELWVAAGDGTLLEARSTPNRVLDGPPWRHHDIAGLSVWIGETLAALCRAHPIRVVVPVGHGSGGVLVGDDGGDTGLVLPMIDYEQACPPDVDADYAGMAGSFEDRGSSVMMASTHAARQLLWMERAAPEAFGAAEHYLNIAQYWAWWLTGVAASEHSAMGAQSHLWNVPEGRWSPIVADRGWRRLMPAFRHAGAALGPVRARVRERFGLPEGIAVLTGAHDSTANFHRYVAAGLRDFTLVSTGTWVVALSREAEVARLDPARGTTINADMEGRPLGGALVMGGRAFSAIAGADWAGAPADAGVVAALVRRGTMALPSFGGSEGQFPGSGGRGRIVGPEPEGVAERTALALLHAALLTVTCADVLDGGETLVLDGTFLREPLYAPLVAALRGGGPTVLSDEPHGVVAGAVRLADGAMGTTPAPVEVTAVTPVALPGLTEYFETWRSAAEQQGTNG